MSSTTTYENFPEKSFSKRFLTYSPLGADRTVPTTEKPRSSNDLTTQTAMNPEAPVDDGRLDTLCEYVVSVASKDSPVTRTVAEALTPTMLFPRGEVLREYADHNQMLDCWNLYKSVYALNLNLERTSEGSPQGDYVQDSLRDE
jgi:hypothetical protein